MASAPVANVTNNKYYYLLKNLPNTQQYSQL